MAVLSSGRLDYDGVSFVFGEGTPFPITGFKRGSSGFRSGDQDRPAGDGRYVGVDRKGAPTHALALAVLGEGVSQVEREAAARLLASRLAVAWNAPGVRGRVGAVAELTVGERSAIGRPREYVPDDDGLWDGTAEAALQFAAVDDRWYGRELVTRVTLVPPTPVQSFEWVGEVDASASVKRVNGEVVARNDFTNPNLVGDGTWAEVRRNVLLYPSLKGAVTGWNKNANTTFTPSPLGVEIVADSAIATDSSMLYRNNDEQSTAPSDSWAGSFFVENIGSVPVTLRARQYWHGAVLFGNGPTTTLGPGESGRLGVVAAAPAGTTHVRLTLGNIGGTMPAGAKIRVRHAINERSPVLGDYVDGATKPAGIVQPEDFRVRWLGTPNASESVMEIERVRGFTSANVIAGVSTKSGKRAVRLIPTGSSSDSYAAVTSGLTDLTALATIHLDGPMTGTTVRPRSVYLTPPQNFGETAPNVAGSYSFRRTTAGGTGPQQVRLYHGGSLGSGDVWWTDIGLFTAGYEGDVFSGSSAPIGSGLAIPADVPFVLGGSAGHADQIMQLGGDVEAFPVFDLHGPIVDPWIDVPGVGRLVMNVTLAYDQVLTVDTRPWRQVVLRDGDPVHGVISAAGVRLSELGMLPGSYRVIFGGYDPSGNSWLDVRVRPAYLSL